jgi:hypothetical protein
MAGYVQGSESSNIAWIPLNYTAKTSEVKPASFTAGTITMSGDTWQLRGIETNTRHLGMDTGWRVNFALPPGLMDGTGGRLEVAVICTSEPDDGAMMGIKIGVLDTGEFGLGCGLEFSKTTTEFRAMVGARATTNNKGDDVVGAFLIGCIDIPGNANASNSVGASAQCSVNTATKGSAAGGETTDSVLVDKDTSTLTAHISKGEITTDGPGDSDWELYYRVIPLPSVP